MNGMVIKPSQTLKLPRNAAQMAVIEVELIRRVGKERETKPETRGKIISPWTVGCELFCPPETGPLDITGPFLSKLLERTFPTKPNGMPRGQYRRNHCGAGSRH
jgi:hypothetical protein